MFNQKKIGFMKRLAKLNRMQVHELLTFICINQDKTKYPNWGATLIDHPSTIQEIKFYIIESNLIYYL